MEQGWRKRGYSLERGEGLQRRCIIQEVASGFLEICSSRDEAIQTKTDRIGGQGEPWQQNNLQSHRSHHVVIEAPS